MFLIDMFLIKKRVLSVLKNDSFDISERLFKYFFIVYLLHFFQRFCLLVKFGDSLISAPDIRMSSGTFLASVL